MLIGSLLFPFPLLAQAGSSSTAPISGEQEALSALSDHLESLEAKLNKNQESFIILSSSEDAEDSLFFQKEELEKAHESLNHLREGLNALSGSYEMSLSEGASLEEQEDHSLSVQSLENRTRSLERELDSLALSFENWEPAQTSATAEQIDLEVTPYVYQEFENGFIIEMKLPTVEGTNEIKRQAELWLDHSIKRSEEVKKLGVTQNNEKPSAPQYLWFASYNQFYNDQLGVTSFVVNFYEYTGTLPGTETIEASLVKNDGTTVKAVDLLTPSQLTYVQQTLNQQVKDDVARKESDLEKKHLKDSTVDLSKAAVFFTENTLEVHFATGEMNTRLGRPAILNLPLKDILAH
jgi:hypothetical protein